MHEKGKIRRKKLEGVGSGGIAQRLERTREEDGKEEWWKLVEEEDTEEEDRRWKEIERRVKEERTWTRIEERAEKIRRERERREEEKKERERRGARKKKKKKGEKNVIWKGVEGEDQEERRCLMKGIMERVLGRVVGIKGVEERIGEAEESIGGHGY